MAETVTVFNGAPMAIRLDGVRLPPDAPPDHVRHAPRDFEPPKPPVLKPGINENVDAVAFRDWMSRNANHDAVLNGEIREATGEDVSGDGVGEFGFQAGLRQADDRRRADSEREEREKADALKAAPAPAPAPAPVAGQGASGPVVAPVPNRP